MKSETEFSFQTRAFCQDSYSRNSIKASFTLSNFVGDCVFLKDANELAHESGIESLFRSKQFQVFCMSFIRSHFPGGKSPTELPVWTRLNSGRKFSSFFFLNWECTSHPKLNYERRNHATWSSRRLAVGASDYSSHFATHAWSRSTATVEGPVWS
jgi:hypothetical protein